MARLIITSPEGKRNMLELTRPLVMIGRGKSNDLVLNNSSVSRLHAVVKRTATGYSISDRGSTNGVLVNGESIPSEKELHDGDAIKIGSYELRFEAVHEDRLVIASAPVATTLEHVLKWHEKTAPAAPPPSESAASSGPGVMEQFWKLEHENYLLRLLFDAGKALHGKISVDDIANAVVELSFRIEGVERGFIMLMDEQGEVTRQTEVKFRRAPTDDVQPQIILSRSILERVRREREPILIMDAAMDERFSQSESLKVSGLRSAMCAPLAGAGSSLPSIQPPAHSTQHPAPTTQAPLFGVLYVDNMEKAAAFSQEEMNVFAVIATQAAAAIDNAMSHQKIADQAVQQKALERFLSPEVVAMIAKDPHGIRLGGVNQKVTIMFADIRGFTSLAEKMPPQQVVEILNEYFTRVTEIIFDHSGTLDKYLGDGVMAVFGAPFSKGNDALNAVKAATSIQRMIKELNRDATERGWPELQVGIGINTGLVTAGNIGSPRRLDYTVVGDPVNVAARLMANAERGQILITDQTRAELPDNFEVSALPPLKVKGKTTALNVYSLERRLAAKAAAIRKQ